MIKIKNLVKENIYLICLIVLTIPTFFSMLRPGFFPMQDDLQAFRVFEMDKCFQDFQLPCRWVPDAGYQYGYPQFEYYPPSVYYLGEVFHLVGFQFIDSIKIVFALGFVLSAVTMFIFLKSLFPELSAFVGAMTYVYIPYKALEVYVRGAMSEFWSLVLFPLVFWSSMQLIRKGGKRNLGWFALSVGLLLVTHNLMSLIFIPAVAVWVISWIVVEKKWKQLLMVGLGGLLGLGLAAFFTLPVLTERPYVHLESLVGGYFDYRQHFSNLEQIFLLNNWGYGSSVLGPGDDLNLSTGIVAWVMGILAVILALIFFKKERKISIIVLSVSLAEVFVLFMMHQKSSFIWEKLSFLEFVQFPWRFLAVSIFLLSFLSASVIYFLAKSKYIKLLGIIVVGAAVISNITFFKPREWFDLTDAQKFSGKLWEKQLTISIFDYLPIYAKLPPTSKAPAKPETLEGLADIPVYKKGSDFQTGIVNVTENAKFRLPLFDFPGMRVQVDGKTVEHKHDDCRGEEFCLGLINLVIPKGNHTIKAELTNTPIRTFGNIASLISFFTILFLLLKKHAKNSN